MNPRARGRVGQARWNGRVRGETAHQWADRQLAELLQEIRVAQAGVQILFAFLLVIPFQASYAATSGGTRAIHLVALLASALSACLLTAPVPFHRILFRRRLKLQLVEAAHLVARLGLGFLAVAMVGSVVLVVRQSMGDGLAWSVGAVAVAVYLAVWLVWPVVLLVRAVRVPPPPEAAGDDDSPPAELIERSVAVSGPLMHHAGRL